MPNLIQLLESNYDRIRDMKEVRDIIPGYLRQAETLNGNTIVFIKKFTKIASRLLKMEISEMAGLEEKLYGFYGEGIDKINADEDPHLSSNNRNSMLSHFHSHRASVAQTIFEQSSDIAWGKKSYAGYLESIKIEKTPEHRGFSWRSAAHVAKEIFNQTSERDWLTKAVEARIKSGDNLINVVQKRAAKEYDHAKDLFGLLFHHDKDVKYLERQFEVGIRAAELYNDFAQPDEASAIYERMGETAFQIFAMSKDDVWKQRAMENFETAKGIYPNTSRRNIRQIIHGLNKKIQRCNNQYNPKEDCDLPSGLITYTDLKNAFLGRQIELPLDRITGNEYFACTHLLNHNGNLEEVAIDIRIEDNFAKISTDDIPSGVLPSNIDKSNDTIYLTYQQNDTMEYISVLTQSTLEKK
tara:strand:- start:6000 stop:7232 length:1233 start_codon:yes stop_codon:yes gene_type:complete